jgi:hypothetical protein
MSIKKVFENPGGGSIWFFAKVWEGGYKGDVKILGVGYTFLVFYCIFFNKVYKNFGGRVHFRTKLSLEQNVLLKKLFGIKPF